MNFAHWASAAALAGTVLSAAAQQTSASVLQPSEPGPGTPNPAYISAFATYRPADVDAAPAPDVAWRKANQEIHMTGGHKEHMKQGDAEATAPTPKTSEQAPPPPARNGAHDGHH